MNSVARAPSRRCPHLARLNVLVLHINLMRVLIRVVTASLTMGSMTSSLVAEVIQHLPPKDCVSPLDLLFEKFDDDRSGLIDGNELDNLLAGVVTWLGEVCGIDTMH